MGAQTVLPEIASRYGVSWQYGGDAANQREGLGGIGLALPISLGIMGALGYLLDRLIIRRLFGESQTAVVILTIALGFVIRFVAGLIWGHEPQTLQNPLAGKELRFGGLVLGLEDVAVIVVTILLTWGLYVFFNRSKLGLAMQGASQN